ncbi:MAG TPA: phosphotransferase family protein [Acidimicrobiia bacterium]|nr:phosphotransferase family protein [Acidimicrobiia bacterium]
MTADADALRAAFTSWLAVRLDATDLAVTSFERPAGGRSNDTFLVGAEWTAADGPRVDRLVVRVQPQTTQIFRAPDVMREAHVLQGLERGGVRVPHVRWCEADTAALGAPFFVMDEVKGNVPLARPSIHAAGWLPTLTVAELGTLWSSALDTLVAVHAVDWRRNHAFLLGETAGTSTVEYVERIAEWYRWSTEGRPYPITDAALDHVLERSHEVVDTEPVLVWGDARVGNMIFGDDGQVAAAIDWETASIGPPEIDVAHWLFFDEFATGAIDVAPLPGWPDAEETVRTYEARSGRTLHDLDLFQTIEELFIAITLIRQADARVARGLASADTRMGHDNAVTQMLARRLGLPVPELSPDYIAHRGGTA